MGNDRKNEMEQIRRGLEAFLEQEIGGAGEPEEKRRKEPGSRQPETRRRGEPEGWRQKTWETQWKEKAEEQQQGEPEGEWQGESEGEWQETQQQGESEEEWREAPETQWKEQPEVPEGRWQKVRNDGWQEGAEKTEWEQVERMTGSRKSRNAGRAAGHAESLETDWDAVPEEPRHKTAGKSKNQGRGTASRPVKTQARSAGTGQQKGGPRRKKRSRKKSGFRRFLTAVVLIMILLGAGLYYFVGTVYGRMNFKEIASVSKLPMREDGVVNILLIGNDSRENGDDGRSDAMILLSISSRTKTIYMTSLLRDMYVEIDGHDGNRLNAAYSYGGAELLMETIEKNFDIPVNRYMLVNFEAFAGLVDAVGGVELELSSEEIEYVNGYLVEYNMLTGRPQGTDDMDTSVSGLVHLNGPQALAYSRNRYLGTDFGRTERQRKVLTAVIKKLPAALLTNAGGLMDGLLPNLTTNLTQNECFRLSLMAGKLLTYELVSDSIPQPGTYKNATIRKMQVLEVDFETNIKYLKEKLYGE